MELVISSPQEHDTLMAALRCYCSFCASPDVDTPMLKERGLICQRLMTQLIMFEDYKKNVYCFENHY